MGKDNKAHTATANRIAQRYGTTYNRGDGPDIQSGDLTIEVETTATLTAAIRGMQQLDGARFVAVTNQEGVVEAVKRARGTGIGVMDPQGEIVHQSDPPYEA